MSINYQKFFQPITLTTSAVVIYTVPATPLSNLFRGGRVRLTNSTSAPKTARLHAVPAAGAVADTNSFFFDQTIPAFGYVDVDVPILAAGDTIQALASATPGVGIQAMTGGVFSA